MATPAEQRLQDLLDKWLESLELHVKYAALDDATYATVQPWPEHQRPTRWIIDLAQQKALTLRTQVRDRVKMGDARFAESLELMMFLANLVAADHIERFIPLASAQSEQPAVGPQPEREKPAADAATATRKMPLPVLSQPRTAAPAGTAKVARSEPKREFKPAPQSVNPPPKASAPIRHGAPKTAKMLDSAPAPGPAGDAPLDVRREQVIADAARLVQWGRKWYELAELISGMADRPPLIDVRRILKDNKAIIDKKAGRG